MENFIDENQFPTTKMLYEGKAKQIFETPDEDKVIVHYKDDASAYNGIKRAQITNKGVLNNKISSIIFRFEQPFRKYQSIFR